MSLAVLHNIDFEKFKVFARVYQDASVTQAARKLGVTPSAVSQSLRGLEGQLNQKLFHRVAKRLLPTPDADRLFAIANGFESALSEFLSASSQARNEPSGLLRIGAPPEFASSKLVPALRAFSAFVGARFSFQFVLPDEMPRLLIENKLDIAFGDYGSYLKAHRRTLHWEEIDSEKIVLACSRSFYEKYVKGDHTLKNLGRLSHIDYREDGKVSQIWYRHHFRKEAPDLRLKLVANNVRAVISGAEAGLGLAFIPVYLIADQLKAKRLIPITTAGEDYENPIVLMRLKDRIPTKLENAAVAEMRKFLGGR